MSYEHILYEVGDSIATITLNRPDKLNAYTATMGVELEDAFIAAGEDDAVRVIVVTGAGRGFCAGADISGGANAFDTKSGDTKMFQGAKPRRSGGGFVQAIYDSKKPSIAAFNGPAVGVGITLALPMDIKIASSDARFGFVFARRGLVPEAGSAWFLPRLVGLNQALRWCLSGRVFSAQEAFEGGLVSEVVAPDRLLPRAREIAREMIENTAPVSAALTRHMLWQYGAQPTPFPVMAIDGALSLELGAGPDVKEGVAAFLEKRKPEFPGKVSEGMPQSFKPAPR
ncbi:MAG: enoyl-CoA hydratase/isomerase family protein [Proteobacteria bacterium]|nr:enoyl-CoA hydratase/isomerase family protein [Pseudomonadota bacterium]